MCIMLILEKIINTDKNIIYVNLTYGHKKDEWFRLALLYTSYLSTITTFLAEFRNLMFLV